MVRGLELLAAGANCEVGSMCFWRPQAAASCSAFGLCINPSHILHKAEGLPSLLSLKLIHTEVLEAKVRVDGGPP